MTTTYPNADHDREPLPLGAVGWLITGAVFVFGAFGYLTGAGIFAATDAASFLRDGGAGALLMTALGGIMQFAGMLGARSIRRSLSFDLEWSRYLSIGLVIAGATFTTYTLHNAFTISGVPLLWSYVIGAGMAFCEISSWWVDESQQSEMQTRRAIDTQHRLNALSGAPAQSSGPFGVDVASLDETALSDPAIEAGITAAASIKKRLENERQRRRNDAARTNA